METLIIDGQHHRNQYCNRSFNRSAGGFGSPPVRKQKGFNCRSYHSGAGLLPTPVKSRSLSEKSIKREIAALSPKTPYDDANYGRKPVRRSAVPIPMAMRLDDGFMKEGCFVDEFHFSELWAGPTYSNSPPPSSLPIPKFSMRTKRTVSLELPRSVSHIDLRPIAKSAPASPSRERSPSPIYFLSDVESVVETSDECYMQREFVDETDYATKTLCRILNLDIHGLVRWIVMIEEAASQAKSLLSGHVVS